MDTFAHAQSPYRLPETFFSDPFEEEPSAQRPELFLPSLVADEEEPVAPTFTPSGEPALTVGERLALVFSVFRRSDGVLSPLYAGADVSAPSPLERLRRRAPLGEPASESRLDGVSDSFGRLLVPLGEPALASLRSEVAADETLFAGYRRARRRHDRRNSLALALALIVLVLFMLFAGRGYLDRALVENLAPAWLASWVGQEAAGAGLFALGAAVLFLSVGAIRDMFRYLLAAVGDTSPLDLVMFLLCGAFVSAVLLLLAEAMPLQAASMLLVWVLVRYGMETVSGRRR